MAKKKKRTVVALIPQHHNPLPQENWQLEEVIEDKPAPLEEKESMFRFPKGVYPSPQTIPDPGLPPPYLIYMVMMSTGFSIGLGFLGVHFFSESGIPWGWFLIPIFMIVIGYILWRKYKDTN